MDESKKKEKTEIATKEGKKVKIENDEVHTKSAVTWTSSVNEEFYNLFEKYHTKVLSQKTKEINENVENQLTPLIEKITIQSTPTSSSNNEKIAAHTISKNNTDDSFKNFMKLLHSNDNIEYTKVVEVNENLFNMSEDFSLAHCVSEDLKMSKGIAVEFKRKFKKIAELTKQKQGQGGLAILSFPPRFIYYLVTKKHYWEKPTLYTLWNSLTKMQNHVHENSVQQVAIPRIGSGLDLLNWNEVKFMIEHIFKDTDVKITVCYIQQKKYTAPSSISQRWILHAPYPVVEIESGTLIIYFGSEDGFVDHSMEELDKKFGILADYKRGTRMLGQVIRTEDFKRDFVIFGFIVQKSSKDDQVDYANVQKCAQEVQKFNGKFGKRGYLYLGLDVFKNSPNETMQFDKVLDILRSTLPKLQVYVCYPKDLKHQMPAGRM